MRTVLLILIMTAGICGSVAGQAMFLPSDEDGAFVQTEYTTTKGRTGFGVGFGRAVEGIEIGFSGAIIDNALTGFAFSTAFDLRRLTRSEWPASIQLGAGIASNRNAARIAIGPSVYVGSTNPIGYVVYVHAGVRYWPNIGRGESQTTANLGFSLAYRARGVIIAANFVNLFNEREPIRTISLSLTLRRPKS